MCTKRVLAIGFFILSFFISKAQYPHQNINPNVITDFWKAFWIAHPTGPLDSYAVYHFRNNFNLETKPDSFIVHVSADNRYKLFVNGTPVGVGPARGDLRFWFFESYDIAPYLVKGKNVIAAVIWNLNFADRPVAQISYKSAFIMQGNSPLEEIINTNADTWKVFQNKGYYPQRVNMTPNLGACDSLVANDHPWNWEKLKFDDTAWAKPKILSEGKLGGITSNNIHIIGHINLTPRIIPMPEEVKERFEKIRRTTGIIAPASFNLEGGKPLTIPANSNVKLLLDNGQLTLAYPKLYVSGGKLSKIKVVYAEALFDKDGNKGNRNNVEDKEITGYYDVFMPDGGNKRNFIPLWIRTYRYVQLEITTNDDPLTIDDYFGISTTYPFKENAKFDSSDPSLKKIWDIGWRTERLCALETFMDCPYYEQNQFIGDIRIQSLVSLYVSGDDRLMRNALNQVDQSRTIDGLTDSRYPSNSPLKIPTFSLLWVAMVHDYHLHRDDSVYVRSFLPGIENVLTWFEKFYDTESGMLKKVKHWNFVDWADGLNDNYKRDVTPIVSLHYIYALDRASELFRYYGKIADAEEYKSTADKMRVAIMQSCFNTAKGLMSDELDKKNYSQHTNILAVLTNTIPENMQKKVMHKVVSDQSLTQCTIYFKFYLVQALQKTGLGDLYLDNLYPWKKMIDDGLTTFAETEVNTRSDCHAWSASPSYDILATVCGIRPDDIGFKSVKIQPNLGTLNKISAKMPHPLGEISVKFLRKDDKLSGEIILPKGLKGKLIWKNKEVVLREGKQNIVL